MADRPKHWSRTGYLAIAAYACALALIGGCFDVRDLEGPWTGPRVGDDPVLQQGIASDASARLVIERADLQSLTARLTVEGLFDDAEVSPLPGAEADVLASMSFDGAPSRVYLAFVSSVDGNGDAMVLLSLHESDRVEIRALRGAPAPLYAVFVLRPE